MIAACPRYSDTCSMVQFAVSLFILGDTLKMFTFEAV